MTTQIVGISLVRNEDLFIERSISNVIDFCDKLIILDNYSTDNTWPIIQNLEKQSPKIVAKRIHSHKDSHRYISSYADSDTWIFGIDGDEIYDPEGLIHLKKDLLSGNYNNDWLLLGNVLHCVEWNQQTSVARGYLNPPSKSMTKLYNFNAIQEWSGNFERLHGSGIKFKPGFHVKLRRKIYFEYEWKNSPFRCLHLCFMKRSSRDKVSTRIGPGAAPKYFQIMDKLGLGHRIAHLILQRHSDGKIKYYKRGNLFELSTTNF